MSGAPRPTTCPSTCPPTSLPPPFCSEAAGEPLWSEFQPLISRLFRRYAATAEDREELAAETYCEFRRLLATYDPARGVPLRPYLVRMLTVSAYTRMRVQWRRLAREVSTSQCAQETLVADPTSEWIERLERQTLERLLPAALERLSPRQRQIVVWRYYEGRAFAEIGLECYRRVVERFPLSAISCWSNWRNRTSTTRTMSWCRWTRSPGMPACHPDSIYVAEETPDFAARAMDSLADDAGAEPVPSERCTQAAILRELVGNPFTRGAAVARARGGGPRRRGQRLRSGGVHQRRGDGVTGRVAMRKWCRSYLAPA